MECIVALMQPPQSARRFRSSGDAAESAWRFKGARLKLVGPPEFFDPPTNAVVLHVSTRSLINAESQSR